MLVKSWAASLLLATASQVDSVLAAPADRTTQDVAEDTVEVIQEIQVAKHLVGMFNEIKAARVTSKTATTTKKPKARKTSTLTTTTKKPKKTSKTTTTTTTTTTRHRKSSSTATTTTKKQKKKPAAATSASTNSSLPASTPVTQSRSTAGKRGLAYNNAQFTNPFGRSPLPINASVPLVNNSLSSTSQVSWTYNWYLSPCTSSSSCGYNPSLMHIPMLWSNKPELLSAWPAAVETALASNATHLFSFNEPDGCFTGSSCMSMSDAVSTYQKYMQPYAGRAALGAPAVTNAGAPHGLDWLGRFMAACDGCTFDFVNVHWYSNKYAGANYFKSFINATRAIAGGRPIWVTEFALTADDEGNAASDADNKAFLEEVMEWMDGEEDVAGYSFFMTANLEGMLMAEDGMGKSALGEVYDSYNSKNLVGGVWGNKTNVWTGGVGASATVSVSASVEATASA
ncbi:Glycosyl hydrolase catalytic core domain-containing protein 1 [Elsinoe fawcettii]|nr:Glycosyl hydrolase catalytic core domain-containing protein 1 [Elsinoe fawcettii]